jgi:hypothetical protein
MREDCKDMLIEELKVSETCFSGLKKAGFTTVGQLIHFLKQIWGGGAGTIRLSPVFLTHFDEIVNALKAMDCWPEDLV